MGKSRSRRHRRRRGGENSLQQMKHGANNVTQVVTKYPKKFADAVGGELTGETRRDKAKRKFEGVWDKGAAFLKKLKFWGGRRRTRRGRRHRHRHRHTRRCRHRRRHRHTKRCRHRRSRRRRRRRRR